MTVSTTTTKNSYSANGTLHSFAYGFKIFADADLTVIVRSATGGETTKTLNTHYVVTNAGSDSGGNVLFKFNTGSSSDAHFSSTDQRPANGETVVILRTLAKSQGTDYVENDPFPSTSHEDALDRLTFITQELQEEVDRTIKLSKTNTMTSPEFTTSATDRASKILAFDSSGELSVTQELGTFKGDSATTTTAAFVQRDIIKATTTAQLNNIYICVADSVIGDALTDTDHFVLLVDAVSAAASATTATTKASEAATSATNASNSASTASGHKDTATTKASEAASSATAAASSATAAASSATSAATALDNFDDIFLGAKSSDPSTDNDGDALNAGDLYFNTTSSVLKVYTGSAWTTISTFTTGIANTNIPVFTSGVANDDFLRVNGTSIEGRSASEVLSDIGASAVAGSSSIVTTGALNAGSITSGFGTINTGSSNITSTGVGAFGSLDISGDIDVDGTTNLDVVDIDGAVDMASTLAVSGAISSSTGFSIGNLAVLGQEIDVSSGDLTLDVAGDIILDAGGAEIKLSVGGTQFGNLFSVSSDFYIKSVVNDKDIIFQGVDNSSAFTAMSLDMSDAGTAIFNHNIKLATDDGFLSSGANDDFLFVHDGTDSKIFNSTGDLIIDNGASDKDIIFKGNDGGSVITALTLDMSAAGDATFNGKVIADTFMKSDDTNTHIAFLGSDVTQFKNGNSESARFIATTFFKAGNRNGTYRDATGQYAEFQTDRSGDAATLFQASDGSYQGAITQIIGTRAAAGDTYRFMDCYSGDAADREFRVDSDGTVHADGSYTGTGADYAEMFEWKDGNTSSEDRVGKTVVLDGNQIRLSTSDDAQATIIGVVSATPVVLGDAQSEKWKEKYETDSYGRYVFEDYTQTEWTIEVEDDAKELKSYQTDMIPSDVTVPDDAIVTSKDENGDNLKRRKLNTAFDASKTYIPREDRKEFSAIGLVGKLRVNVGQTVGDRWIKMREISDTVHEYLVR